MLHSLPPEQPSARFSPISRPCTQLPFVSPVLRLSSALISPLQSSVFGLVAGRKRGADGIESNEDCEDRHGAPASTAQDQTTTPTTMMGPHPSRCDRCRGIEMQMRQGKCRHGLSRHILTHTLDHISLSSHIRLAQLVDLNLNQPPNLDPASSHCGLSQLVDRGEPVADEQGLAVLRRHDVVRGNGHGWATVCVEEEM